MVIHGESNIGKTLIVRKFQRDHPMTFDDARGVERRKIVAMQMPATPGGCPNFCVRGAWLIWFRAISLISSGPCQAAGGAPGWAMYSWFNLLPYGRCGPAA
jgi:hypothetical protein